MCNLTAMAAVDLSLYDADAQTFLYCGVPVLVKRVRSRHVHTSDQRVRVVPGELYRHPVPTINICGKQIMSVTKSAPRGHAYVAQLSTAPHSGCPSRHRALEARGCIKWPWGVRPHQVSDRGRADTKLHECYSDEYRYYKNSRPYGENSDQICC